MTKKNEILSEDLSHTKKRLRRLVKEKTICKYSDDNALPIPKPPRSPMPEHEDDNLQNIPSELLENKEAGTDVVYPPHTPVPAEPIPSMQPSLTSTNTTTLPIPTPASHLEHETVHVGDNRSLTPSVQPHVDVSVIRDGSMVPSSRPKRMRRGPVEPKMRRVQPLERDSVTGQYKLPARVGILTVHSLGRVVPLPTYHNDRYIWPPGFKVSRTYLSMINPNLNTVYTCSVEENGEQGPRFRVVADDCPDQPIIANSATGVWTAIVKRANEIRNREHSNSASGPDYYGFTHATIAKMIQDLPGADQCLNYVWQKFGVMHQRTAAGVAAAAQKKLTNLEIMGSANKKPPASFTEGVRDGLVSPVPTSSRLPHAQVEDAPTSETGSGSMSEALEPETSATVKEESWSPEEGC
ncbi:hypothetical protein EC973_009472 [Apophysomyces ossiformis]|uniref:Transforming growth factor beta regulator 1 n=1 Tax=Apophysomyces ossiformis TaxID=679940 RepID=A0A8H7BS09_9FUNG|nr:hypothetical protein EC973_009472 [Apophysomyces ossiformis]